MKTFKYLEKLPLTRKEKKRITAQGYAKPEELYALIQAARDAFKSWLGRTETKDLEDKLWSMMSENEKAAYWRPLENHGTGALDPKDLQKPSPSDRGIEA